MIGKIFHFIIKQFLSSERYARVIGVNIGRNNLVQRDCWSSEPYLITVGSHVQITEGVKIHTHGGGNVVRNEMPDFDCFGKVIIKDWAYIGSGSHIMPGVTIGERVLVCAGSIITKSVPDGMVVGGNPATILCSVEEYKMRNLKYNIYSKQMTSTKKRQLLLQLDEFMFVSKSYLKIDK